MSEQQKPPCTINCEDEQDGINSGALMVAPGEYAKGYKKGYKKGYAQGRHDRIGHDIRNHGVHYHRDHDVQIEP